MIKSEIFKKAHLLTKATIQAGDNYQATFGLCLKAVLADIKQDSSLVFSRKRSDGSLLECRLNDPIKNRFSYSCLDYVAFYVNGELIGRGNMCDIVPIDTYKDRMPADTYQGLINAGATHFWSDKVVLYPHEAELINQVIAQGKQAQKIKDQYTKEHHITVFLSSRGFGDYDNLVWTGDSNLSDDEILSECQALYTKERDVDLAYNVERVLTAIQQAKAEHQSKKAEQAQAKAQAQQVVDNVSPRTLRAYEQCNGNPYNLQDDIDHPLFWAVKEYVEALQILA